MLIEKELLDIPSLATRREVEGNLVDIAAANRWLGGTSAIMRSLSHLICMPPAHQPVRMLDCATGGADIPIAIAMWARKMGVAVQITSVDNNPMVVEIARQNTREYPEICVDRQNILMLPYEDQSFDFVTISQALHHLNDVEVVQALRSANRLTTQGIVVSDLRRCPLCIQLANLASLFVTNRLSSHDARLSFRNAFTKAELIELAGRADIPPFTLHFQGPCRIVMVVDKRNIVCEPTKKPATATYQAMDIC